MSELSERERRILLDGADILEQRGIHYGAPLSNPARPNDCEVCVLVALSVAGGYGPYGWGSLDWEEHHLLKYLAGRITDRQSGDDDWAKAVYEWNDINMPTAAEAAALLRSVAA